MNDFTNTELSLDELANITAAGGASFGDFLSEVYSDLKSVTVFYGKWAGGVAGGKSWDRAALDAGKAAGIPGMECNNCNKEEQPK